MLQLVFFLLLWEYLFALLLATHVISLWFNQFSIGGDLALLPAHCVYEMTKEEGEFGKLLEMRPKTIK